MSDTPITPDDIAGESVRPRRRANLSSHLPVRFSPDVLAAARRLAIEDGMSVSSWVRRTVERAVLLRSPSASVSSGQNALLHGLPDAPTVTLNASGVGRG